MNAMAAGGKAYAKARQMSIAHEMFIDTADQNYILARHAHQLALGYDFFWLSLHAIEKYYKAILLLNGRTSKGFGHNITKLHEQVMKLWPALPIGSLADPKVPGLTWFSESYADFIKRLNQVGGADSRYGTYGHRLLGPDLLKVDQVVWQVRRCCRPLASELVVASKKKTLNEIDYLKRNPRSTIVGHPIEKLLKRPKGDPARESFLYGNFAFDPGQSRNLRYLSMQSVSSPIDRVTEDMKKRPRSANKADAEALRWALDHIKLSPDDTRCIQDVITRFG